jgi:hypothetical protein
MKKDIIRFKVEGVYVAIARKRAAQGNYQWFVYLINDNNFSLEYVIIASQGYGRLEGENRKTSVLRQMFEKVAPKSFEVIEPIDPKLFSLCNEFWVSYYLGRDIYDKKFIFLPEALTEDYIAPIEFLGLEGILHN